TRANNAQGTAGAQRWAPAFFRPRISSLRFREFHQPLDRHRDDWVIPMPSPAQVAKSGFHGERVGKQNKNSNSPGLRIRCATFSRTATLARDASRQKTATQRRPRTLRIIFESLHA